MKQMARNATMDDCGAVRGCRYLLHDRDTKFTQSFRAIRAIAIATVAWSQSASRAARISAAG